MKNVYAHTPPHNEYQCLIHTTLAEWRNSEKLRGGGAPEGRNCASYITSAQVSKEASEEKTRWKFYSIEAAETKTDG